MMGLASLPGFIRDVAELLDKQDVCKVLEKLIYAEQVCELAD